jgi:hypothetical protein
VPARYELLIDGPPNSMLEAAFVGFEITDDRHGRVRMVGTLADQAALHGALHRLHDLQLEILELRRVDTGPG